MPISLENILAPENLRAAWERVRRNDGCAGADALSIAEFDRVFAVAAPRLAEQIREGSYTPLPFREARIPKPGGGQRTLRIPAVPDRFVQQALALPLTAAAEPRFSPASFAYRAGRGQADALAWFQALHREPEEQVLHLDIADFFDTVPHAIALDAAASLTPDSRIHALIAGMLRAGTWNGGAVAPLECGLPQGSPLSPLLANLVLDPLDRALTGAGRRFVRYADDLALVLPAGADGPASLAWIDERLAALGLKLNRAKCACTDWNAAHFLGFDFRLSADGPHRRIGEDSLASART